MDRNQSDLLKIIDYIEPSGLDYQEWVSIGMALQYEGYPVSVWDNWSRKDPARYHAGECERKWRTFHGADTPVTGGTVVQMAKEHGWMPEKGHELDWDDIIERDPDIIIDRNYLEDMEIHEPADWKPDKELIRYLETLFDSTENVGYVTACFEKNGKYMPTKGSWDRTAGELIEQLVHCNGDIGAVLGDYNPQAGAWIRFNPLDGNGCKNENVTDFRYALVESDSMDLERQNAIIRELELPVACLVHSGNKSLHAIVRVEAADYAEYRKRVDYLYNICQKNGLKTDNQNRNPSRLSRMPGIVRNGHRQFLLDTNIGKASWNEWYEWIESINDDLPEPESMADTWDSLPELSKPLIEGVLRQGHKMLLAGPSKAGKSFSLIELSIAIAEGRKWMGWQCAQGRVLYVNLELDRASCLHRVKDVYEALGWKPYHLDCLDIWNLRGKSVPMDKLAPKLIRRAAKKNYIAVIIDPIYKVITGDENSADQMAKFCNQFDLVCTELGCAVIYCHHHSKGGQGSKKSMDRASGSGVFARDPDALLDMIELELSEDILKQEENKAVCAVCRKVLETCLKEEDWPSQDDVCSSYQMMNYCENKLDKEQWEDLKHALEPVKKKIKELTAWRIEGTLREFPKFPPVNLWFRYPAHEVDDVGILGDIQPEDELPPYKKASKAKKKSDMAKKKNDELKFLDAIQNSNAGEPPTVKMVAEYLSTSEKEFSERTVRDWGKRYGYDFKIGEWVNNKDSEEGGP
ncbi:MAG TPA: DNA primase [Lachnospiraceae bacterium]|nr:DNA primase [Lachnospiraceae bacterium]